MASINNLPSEIVKDILSYIPFNSNDFLNTTLVCRQFYGIMRVSDTTFVARVTRNSFPVVYQLFTRALPITLSNLNLMHDLDKGTAPIINEINNTTAGSSHGPDSSIWEDMLYKALMLWTRFQFICWNHQIPPRPSLHHYHTMFTEETHLLFRYISAILADHIAKTYEQPTANHFETAGPGLLLRTTDRSIMINLTSAYHMLYPMIDTILQILISTKYDPNNPICLPGLHSPLRALLAVSQHTPSLVTYIDRHKAGPITGTIVSWLCDRNEDTLQASTAWCHTHYVIFQQLLLRLFQAEGIASDMELLSYIACHDLVPPQVVVGLDMRSALDAVERGQSVQRLLLIELLKRSNLEGILDKELMRDGSKLRKSMDGIGEVFREGITALNVLEFRLADRHT